jgi:hypothetical protein
LSDRLYVCWSTRVRHGYRLFLWGGLMSVLLKRAEHYRHLANEFRRLAANDSSVESGKYYLQMARYYSTLAEAAELKTTPEASEPRLDPRRFRSNGWRFAQTASR